MTTLAVPDLTSHFVAEFEQLKHQIAQLSSVPQTAMTAPDLEQRLAAALAEVATLQESLASERTALAKANSQVSETSRVVAELRSDLIAAAVKGCSHCDQLREQLKSRQTELQLAKSSQQTLQDRIREFETVPAKAAVVAADPHELNLLRQQNQVLRQEKDEAAARLKECEKFKLKIEMDRLKQLNP